MEGSLSPPPIIFKALDGGTVSQYNLITMKISSGRKIFKQGSFSSLSFQMFPLHLLTSFFSSDCVGSAVHGTSSRNTISTNTKCGRYLRYPG